MNDKVLNMVVAKYLYPGFKYDSRVEICLVIDEHSHIVTSIDISKDKWINRCCEKMKIYVVPRTDKWIAYAEKTPFFRKSFGASIDRNKAIKKCIKKVLDDLV